MISQYIQLLEKVSVTPNFYCSVEYFEKAEFKEMIWRVGGQEWFYVLDEDWIVFPPIDVACRKLAIDLPRFRQVTGCKGIWSDFPGYEPLPPCFSTLLDHEFIYRPTDFLNIAGSKWEVFRKNLRKFPARYNKRLNYRPVKGFRTLIGNKMMTCPPIEDLRGLNSQLDDMMVEWLSGFPENAIIHDDEIMLKYLHNGENRDILQDEDGAILGVNIWDENYYYVNYRYCICRRIPFLSEYMRGLFYTNPFIIARGKLVCDGGDLGEPKLFKFKSKLNPISVREVHSWI